MKLSTVFRRLDTLFSDERRWVQDNYKDARLLGGSRPLQCFCLAGGLAKVQGDNPNAMHGDYRGYQELKAAMRQLHPGSEKAARSVEAWNDVRGRKISDIRAVVKRALKNAQNAEAANA